jgi:hypothetical protein
MTGAKTARTVKDYRVDCFGHSLLVPEGSLVSNQTAMGLDDSYRFWADFHKEVERVTGFPDSMLKHDLTFYGLNIPVEFCGPYGGER